MCAWYMYVPGREVGWRERRGEGRGGERNGGSNTEKHMPNQHKFIEERDNREIGGK